MGFSRHGCISGTLHRKPADLNKCGCSSAGCQDYIRRHDSVFSDQKQVICSLPPLRRKGVAECVFNAPTHVWRWHLTSFLFFVASRAGRMSEAQLIRVLPRRGSIFLTTCTKWTTGPDNDLTIRGASTEADARSRVLQALL